MTISPSSLSCEAKLKIQNPNAFLEQIVTFKLTLYGDWTNKDFIIMKNQNKIIIENFSVANRLDFPNIYSEQVGRKAIFTFKFVKKQGSHLTEINLEGVDGKVFLVTELRVEHTTCPENSLYNPTSGCSCKAGYFKEMAYNGFQCSMCSVRCKTCGSFSSCLDCNTEKGFIKDSQGNCLIQDGKSCP